MWNWYSFILQLKITVFLDFTEWLDLTELTSHIHRYFFDDMNCHEIHCMEWMSNDSKSDLFQSYLISYHSNYCLIIINIPSCDPVLTVYLTVTVAYFPLFIIQVHWYTWYMTSSRLVCNAYFNRRDDKLKVLSTKVKQSNTVANLGFAS